MPAVSVITPAWNAAEFIRETIDSVQAQTSTDWELVLVDDGSTDDTIAIAESYAAVDRRVRLVRQANSGPSAARNHGMRVAADLFHLPGTAAARCAAALYEVLGLSAPASMRSALCGSERCRQSA